MFLEINFCINVLQENDFLRAVGVQWVNEFILYNFLLTTRIPALITAYVRHVLFFLHLTPIIQFCLIECFVLRGVPLTALGACEYLKGVHHPVAQHHLITLLTAFSIGEGLGITPVTR